MEGVRRWSAAAVWPCMCLVPAVLSGAGCSMVAAEADCSESRTDGVFSRSPVGLSLGLAAVAVSQVSVCAYHMLHSRGAFGEVSRIQPGTPPQPFWAGLAGHLMQPGGVLLLVAYLTLTWVLDLMPESYYSFSGGVEWHLVAAQLLLQDQLQAMMHALEHGVAPLYRFAHRDHHKHLRPRFFDAFSGSCADTVTMIVAPLYATALAVPANVWSYMTFGAVYSGWLMLLHSEHPHVWEPAFSRLWLGTAADHSVHHFAFNYNFGHLWMGWDKAAGTYREPAQHFPSEGKAEKSPQAVSRELSGALG